MNPELVKATLEHMHFVDEARKDITSAAKALTPESSVPRYEMNDAIRANGNILPVADGLYQRGKVEATLAAATNDVAKMKPDQIDDLAKRTSISRILLTDSVKGVGAVCDEFKAVTDKHCQELHATKAAIVGNISAIKRELQDIRQFFMADAHVEEVARLREFVGLCERLKQLHADGTLGHITDCVIKMGIAKL